LHKTTALNSTPLWKNQSELLELDIGRALNRKNSNTRYGTAAMSSLHCDAGLALANLTA
jgi:hypothetical protein